MKRISILLVIALILTLVPTTVLAQGSTSASFTDVKNHWARNSIELGARLGLVNGVGNNKYSPNSNVTREAFVALIVRAAGGEKTSGFTLPQFSPFSDVANDRWSAKDIKIATHLGWIVQSDYEKFLFHPSQNLTREEAASLLRALLFGPESVPTEMSTELKFTDAKEISAKHKADVSLLSSLGIIQGSDGKFHPKKTLTRAESIALILRALSYQSNILAYLSNMDGQHEVALGYATSAFTLAPNSNSTAQLASAYLGLGEFEEAEKLYTTAVKEGYDNPYALSGAALAAYEQGDYVTAVKYQQVVVKGVPKDVYQTFLLAQYQGMAGNYKDALEIAETTLKLDTEGVLESDISELIILLKELMQPKSALSHKEVKVLFWGAVSDWIDKNKDYIQIASFAVSFIPVVGTGVAIAANAVVVGNSVARAVADPSSDNMIDAMKDVLGAAAGPAIKHAGKLVAKGVGNALTSKAINNRVMDQVIKNGEWDELTNLERYGDSINSYINTGQKLEQFTSSTGKWAKGLGLVDNGVGIGLDFYDKYIKGEEPPKPGYMEAPKLDPYDVLNISSDYLYQFTLNDGKTEYDMLIYSDGDIYEEEWPWACALEGDRTVGGKVTTTLINKQAVKATTTVLGSTTINMDSFAPYALHGDKNIVVIPSCEASSMYTGTILYIKDGKTFVNYISMMSAKSVKPIGNGSYQSVYYERSDITGWVFKTWKFDDKTGKIVYTKTHEYLDSSGKWDEGQSLSRRWFNEPSFYVK